MNRLVLFVKYFFLCFVLSAIAWLVIGFTLSEFITSFTFHLIMSVGVGMGIGSGLVNGSFIALKGE